LPKLKMRLIPMSQYYPSVPLKPAVRQAAQPGALREIPRFFFHILRCCHCLTGIGLSLFLALYA